MEASVATWIKGMAKSKTININALLAAALCGWAATKGIPLDPATATIVVALMFAVVNGALRLVTKKSIPEKALVIQNPLFSEQLAEHLERDPDALAKVTGLVLDLLRLRQEVAKGGGKPIDLAALARLLQATKGPPTAIGG